MVHPSLEPYVNAVRAEPASHPSLVSADERRVAYRETALTHRGDVQPMESIDDVELAPDHPFPAGINDAVDTIRYVLAHLAEFDDPDAEVIVMGDSAGATLMTVACALTRNENLGIVAQVVIYPTLGPELFTDSVHKFGVGHALDIDHLRYDYGLYLGGWTDHSDPRISPLMFDDLTGAPPAIVVVAECDPLRDEAVAYAGLLEHFGVRVELLEAEGMIHGFLRLPAMVPEALEIIDDLAVHMHRLVEAAK